MQPVVPDEPPGTAVQSLRLTELPAVRGSSITPPSRALGPRLSGPAALAPLAVAALAVGAASVGALAIRRLGLGRGEPEMRFDRLVIREMQIETWIGERRA